MLRLKHNKTKTNRGICQIPDSHLPGKSTGSSFLILGSDAILSSAWRKKKKIKQKDNLPKAQNFTARHKPDLLVQKRKLF